MKMLRLFLGLTLICGIIYPAIVTVIGLGLFPDEASGSLIKEGNKILGSRLIAQKFERDDFFHPRPSAADYATVASGASQWSPTHKAGKELRDKRMSELPGAGIDAWTSSGSGLDPHISPKNALFQVKRIAHARGITAPSLEKLVTQSTEPATLGIWGRPRVNVLELNIALLKGNDGQSRSTSRDP